MNINSEYIEVGGWHLKKEVTIGQIITIITILVSGLWWGASVEARISKNKIQSDFERLRIEQKLDITFENMTDKFDRYQAQVRESMGRIDRHLEAISQKLDRKADK